MKSFAYVIKDKEGMHARPAGIVVAVAKKFNCNITLLNKGKSADLKRLFAVMGLCVKHGEEVVINCDGDDESDAIKALQKVFSENL